VLPQMIERRSGKSLVVGTAAALRGVKGGSPHSAARGAQLAYVQGGGVEVSAHNVRVNAIAQNFVENPSDFPPVVQADARFKDRLKSGKFLSAGWSPRAKMRSLLRISVASAPIVPSVKCFLCAAARSPGAACGS
jgi:NAD(P)-dependent dehydrogenase (short-subunit alcohol dehydrogenase family)